MLLKCLQDMEWFVPDYFYSSMIDMHGNISMWSINRFTEGGFVSRYWPNDNRLQVIRQIQTGHYVLQISNASVFDEGLHFCEDSEMTGAPDYYILQLISK